MFLPPPSNLPSSSNSTPPTLFTNPPLPNTSARPEVRGTADVGWQSLFPLPFNPPRTHSRLYHHMCLRTDGQ